MSENQGSEAKPLNKKSLLLAAGVIAGAAGLFKVLKKKATPSKAIVVLGAGRSGTSVLTRCINIIGVNLGSDFVKPDRTNPRGFFENKKIVQVQKKLIKMLDHRPFPEGWQHREKVKPLREELQQYVKDEFADKKVWGWKDPRTNDLLDMWNEIFEELNIDARYLIIIRNPVDVVASSTRAYNREETWAGLQWQIRTLLALKGSPGKKRMIVEYDELFNHSLDCMRRIAKTFDLPWPRNESKIKKELDSFIDPNLQHSNSKTDMEEFAKRTDIEEDKKALYLLCLKGARNQKFMESEEFSDRVDELYKAYVEDHGKLSYKASK